MAHFSIYELSRSKTAADMGIQNNPTADQRKNLVLLIDDLLDPIRTKWGSPIQVNSGFRCRELNRAIGGVPNSHHLQGMAADITAGSNVKNEELFKLILDMHKNGDVKFTQLINEKNYSWIHISYDVCNLKNQVL